MGPRYRVAYSYRTRQPVENHGHRTRLQELDGTFFFEWDY
jgi:hypothetical protein